MTSILIVEDEKAIREVLEQILARYPEFSVIGSLSSATDAIEFLKTHNPDAIILDVFLPKMTGLEFLSWLEKNHPIPVILLTVAERSKLNLEKFNYKNLYYISKPNGTEQDFLRMLDELIDTLRNIKRFNQKVSLPTKNKVSFQLPQENRKIELIAIGASTGGTQAIEYVIKNLQVGVPPIVIVQHMPENFTKMLASRLNQISKLNIKEAQNGELMQPDHVYIAPGGIHCHVVYSAGRLYISLQDYEKVSSHKPSVDVLFYSIAESKVAPKTLAILLTGMGSDGAAGLLAIRKAGGITVGQDEQSSVVYGMPKVAYDSGAVMYQTSLQDIPAFIDGILKNNKNFK